MEIYIIRHGSTNLDENKVLVGWLDPELNDNGIKQAEMLADYLRNEDISKIYSSDLKRTLKTAELISRELGLPVKPTDALRTLNFGDLQGKKSKEVRGSLDSLNEQWKFDPNIEAPDGESFRSFQDRIYNFITKVINESDKDNCVVLVTHGRVCLYLAQLTINRFKKLKGDDIDRLITIDVDHGNYLELTEIDGIMRISGVNQLDQEGIETEKSPETSAAGT